MTSEKNYQRPEFVIVGPERNNRVFFRASGPGDGPAAGGSVKSMIFRNEQNW